MKRDFDLIRKILLEAESWDPALGSFTIDFPDEYPKAEVLEHIDLLIEAGLLNGKVLNGANGRVAAVVNRLTWEGHDFLEAARKETLWNRAKDIIKDKGSVMTLAVLQEVLKHLATAALSAK